jgi:ABC-type branched-subunit amino acid transport system substrate-binding protein
VCSHSNSNNKTDGVADDLLPNTQLTYAYRDSKRSSQAAFFGALELARETFVTAQGRGVSAIVGAASSGPSGAAARVTAQYEIPQISYSSSSATLSNGNEYPYFARMPPSDAFQGDGMADLIMNQFGFSGPVVSTAASTDSYGSAGMAAFLAAAAREGITVRASVNFANDVRASNSGRRWSVLPSPLPAAAVAASASCAVAAAAARRCRAPLPLPPSLAAA